MKPQEAVSEFLKNFEKLHTTPLGEERIRRNLSLTDTKDIVSWCKNKINDPKSMIKREGKNWYITIDGCIFTVNAASYTIITAHMKK